MDQMTKELSVMVAIEVDDTTQYSMSNIVSTIKCLVLILSNIVKNPQERKFQKIKFENSMFKKNILSNKGAH
eukprot:Awhi_evm2s12693